MRRDVALPNLAGSRLEHLALACRELRLNPWPAAPLPATLTSLHVLLEVRSWTRRQAGSPSLRDERTHLAHTSRACNTHKLCGHTAYPSRSPTLSNTPTRRTHKAFGAQADSGID